MKRNDETEATSLRRAALVAAAVTVVVGPVVACALAAAIFGLVWKFSALPPGPPAPGAVATAYAACILPAILSAPVVAASALLGGRLVRVASACVGGFVGTYIGMGVQFGFGDGRAIMLVSGMGAISTAASAVLAARVADATRTRSSDRP